MEHGEVLDLLVQEFVFVELDAVGEVAHHVSEEVVGVSAFRLVFSADDDLDEMGEETPVFLGAGLGAVEDDRGHLHSFVALVNEIWGDGLHDNREDQVLQFQQIFPICFNRFHYSLDCHHARAGSHTRFSLHSILIFDAIYKLDIIRHHFLSNLQGIRSDILRVLINELFKGADQLFMIHLVHKPQELLQHKRQLLNQGSLHFRLPQIINQIATRSYPHRKIFIFYFRQDFSSDRHIDFCAKLQSRISSQYGNCPFSENGTFAIDFDGDVRLDHLDHRLMQGFALEHLDVDLLQSFHQGFFDSDIWVLLARVFGHILVEVFKEFWEEVGDGLVGGVFDAAEIGDGVLGRTLCGVETDGDVVLLSDVLDGVRFEV